jgi:probable HAF family extracellular repeat protein
MRPPQTTGASGQKFGTTWGFGINDEGGVGQGTTAQNGYHGFVYSGKKIQDLNKLVPNGSGWTLYEARGINNAGQIVCSAMNTAGAQHAFLLTPKH